MGLEVSYPRPVLRRVVDVNDQGEKAVVVPVIARFPTALGRIRAKRERPEGVEDLVQGVR